ncbi:nuclease-related domain-containing protein [Bacillus alkalisoli]|uniref:nuclease-related domain-containing protein n=1 Tax=Bacillus alkalisoli TaxID=2011008 RepID=UPI000C23AF60|nr:nuclease-related domain-containing protein [Bacillus alkalisoli]
MLGKPYEIPYNVHQLTSLERRTNPAYPKLPFIQKDLVTYSKGYKGEHSLDYYFQMLPENTFYIYHYLRLRENKFYFQVDLLLLTLKFLAILEVKTMKGKLFLDTKGHQLIQTYNDTEVTYQCPIIQVDLQAYRLRKWLIENKLPDIPIIPLVVVANSSTKIETNDTHRSFYEKVIHAHYLPTKLSKLLSMYQEDILSYKSAKSLNKFLLKKHTPLRKSILENYNMTKNDLTMGVFCPCCSHLPMIKKQKGWFCPKCKVTDKMAHSEALKDYYYLFGNKISNKEARELLLIESADVTKRLLGSMNLKQDGHYKNRKYLLDTLI